MSFIIEEVVYNFPCIIFMGFLLPLLRTGAGLVGGLLGRRRQRREQRRQQRMVEEARARAREALGAGQEMFPALRAGVERQLAGQLPPGMEAQLGRVAGEQQARLAQMGILTGGRTLPEVLRAQTEQLLLPAYQQAQQQALEMQAREMERRRALAGLEMGGM